MLQSSRRPDGRHRPRQLGHQLHHLLIHVEAVQENLPGDFRIGESASRIRSYKQAKNRQVTVLIVK